MSHPYFHALSSVRKFGACESSAVEFEKIHSWFDSTKSSFPSVRHRAILHHLEGVELAKEIFGAVYPYIMDKDGNELKINTHDLGIQHLDEDCSYLPTLDDWFEGCGEIEITNRMRKIDAIRLANLSASSFGGDVEDYIAIHEFIDQFNDDNVYSRSILHHAFGIFLVEQKFGIAIERSNGKKFPTRIIAEQHMEQEFNGYIPTIEDWVAPIKFDKKWQRTGAKNLSKDYID